MAQPTQFVKLHSLESETGKRLNGKTATLGEWQNSSKRYKVVCGGRSYMIKVENMYELNKGWLAEVRRTPMKNRVGDMMSKFNAPGVYPCPIEALQVLPKHYGVEGTSQQLVQSWWGPEVYLHIREQMELQRHRKGAANRDMDLAIRQGTLMIAGVRSDGGHQMQEYPGPTHPDGKFVMVWPTIVYPVNSDTCLHEEWRLWYWSYCQGLALQPNASPWVANPDALELYSEYIMIETPPPQIPNGEYDMIAHRNMIEAAVRIEELYVEDQSSVRIEELYDEDPDTEDWNMC